MKKGLEINFDGIVGPTHHYGGLSLGNIASMEHAQRPSNPKKAALEGLAKMEVLRKMGIMQAILPPHERPFIPILRSLGYYGSDKEVIEKVGKENLPLLSYCSSSSSMWAANAATISPSADSNDKRIHFTPANLVSTFHRSFESHLTGMVFSRIFQDPLKFAHHLPLPFQAAFADEGAANHTRLCREYDQKGIQLFVYGSTHSEKSLSSTNRFPARQTEAASKALIRLHRLDAARVVLAQQSPEAIDAGVFHNDVISTGNQHLFFYHERAFVNTPDIIQQLQTKFETICGSSLIVIQAAEKEIPLKEAIKTYLFNSQLVTLADDSMALVAPLECSESPLIRSYLDELIKNNTNPINQILFQDVRESMQNGGGPACLRLRIALSSDELALIPPSVILSEPLYQQLVKWVEKHYRDTLIPSDLADPQLLLEGFQALDELSKLLQLGPLYSFQRMGAPPALPRTRS